MGNRASIVFTNPQRNMVSPAIYLHWHGPSAPELIARLAERMRDDPMRDGCGVDHTSGHCAARLCGLAHEMIPGNWSLVVENVGIDILEHPENYSPGDCGLIIVDCTDFTWHRADQLH